MPQGQSLPWRFRNPAEAVFGLGWAAKGWITNKQTNKRACAPALAAAHSRRKTSPAAHSQGRKPQFLEHSAQAPPSTQPHTLSLQDAPGTLPSTYLPTGWSEGRGWKCHLVYFSKWEKKCQFQRPIPLGRYWSYNLQDAFLWSPMQENLRMPLPALGMFPLEINLSDCRVPWVLVEVLDV